MLLPIHSSAPGKLVVAGEYAVLDGAPAISLAVASRAKVSIEAARDLCTLVVISSDRDVFEFGWTRDGHVSYPGRQPAERGTMLQQVVSSLKSSLPATMPLVRITIDSSEFYSAETVQKLGLGSSAAVCVALTAALHRLFESSADIDALCFQVHSDFQGGKGSGVDVASSLGGGLIRFQRQPAQSAAELPQIKALESLQGLHMLPVWTGCAASTSEMLQRLDTYRNSSPDGYQQLIDELTQMSTQLIEVWQQQNIAAVLDLVALYADGLQRLDAAADVGIYSEPHLEFQRRAASIGAVYKPSGAGGGDFGLIFTDSAATIEQLTEEFASAVVLSDWVSMNRGLQVKAG